MNNVGLSAIASLVFAGMPAFAADKAHASLESADLLTFDDDEPQQGRMDVGAGVGIQYGLIGVNGEYFVGNNFSLTAGVGHFESFAFDVGVNVYFWSSPDRWCPLVSVNYGTVDQKKEQAANSFSPATSDESFESVSFGFGFKKLWGRGYRTGMLLMINYIAGDAIGYNVKIVPTIGYVYRF